MDKPMTDRELLELAAKAAGGELLPTTEGYPYWAAFKDTPAGPWNPLEDDADAMRLIIRLEMRYGYNVMNDEYEAVANNLTHRFGASDKDPRRVIVLVAAAIGDAMP